MSIKQLAHRIAERVNLRHILRAQDDDDREAISHLRQIANEVYADGHISLQDIEALAAAVEVLRTARANTPDAP